MIQGLEPYPAASSREPLEDLDESTEADEPDRDAELAMAELDA